MNRELREEVNANCGIGNDSQSDSVADRDAALTAYQTRMAMCRRCVEAGYLTRAHPVFHGYAHQRLMIVGQAPGIGADTTSTPWVGRSGDILREWFARAGFSPDAWWETWYLTSLTKCFPGKSATGKGDRVPSRAEIALCADHLEMELRLVQPEIVVTIGKLAASRLIPGANRLPLTELVGTIREVELVHGSALVVPLPHPSGVSRWLNDPANMTLVDKAMRLLGEERIRRGM